MKKKDDEVIDRKKMLHSEMMDRGIVMEKKSRKSRDRTKKQPKEHHERQSRDKTRSKSRTGSKHLSRSKTREKSASVVTFSNIHESKTFTEIDEKTQRSIEDSCSSGVQSGSNTSDLDSLNSPKATTRMKKVLNSRSEKSSSMKTSSDSENSLDSEHKFKESLRLKAIERKQRHMETKVEEQEKKLADFAAKLSHRKSKLEDLHSRLKQRKSTLKEREEKLRQFEAQIAEREERLRAKTKVVRHQEAKLRHEEGSVKLREESVSDKLLTLERRTKLIEMKEDLSAEITELTRKQLYQSSWNLAGTLKHKKREEYQSSTDSLDLSDCESLGALTDIGTLRIAKSNKVGLVL